MDVKFPHVSTATLFKAENIRRISFADRIDPGDCCDWIMFVDSLSQYQPG